MGHRIPGCQRTPRFRACNRAIPGCLPGASFGGAGSLIDPNYHTPYALHASAGVQYAFNSNWTLSADYIRETGMHAYRAYNYVPGYSLFSPLYPSDVVSQQDNVPNIQLYKTDNRSSYNALAIHVQGNMAHWFNLTANYTLASAKTWGCTVGELFDYVNGVCNALNRLALATTARQAKTFAAALCWWAVFYLPAKFQVSTLMQFESARPYHADHSGRRQRHRRTIRRIAPSSMACRPRWISSAARLTCKWI